jgi:hypothetical protein
MKHVLVLAIAACGGNSGPGITMTVGDDPPAYLDTPFPTDAVKQGETIGTVAGLDRVAGHKTDLIAAHLGALDGFGLRPLVEFPIDGDVELADADLAAAAALVDVDPGSPERGRAIAMDWHYFPDRQVIAGSPQSGQILREGTRYAAYVTTDAGLRSLDRGALAHHARWQTTSDALAELPANLAGIAVFTTQRASAPLVAARSQMATLPAPTLAFDNPAIIFKGTTAIDKILGRAQRFTDGPRAGLEHWGGDSPTGVAHDHVGVIGTGEMTITRFRGDDTGTDLPGDETFQLDVGGTPQLISIDRIPITFILPAAPPPADGYPVVIHGHGLGSSRDALLSFAEPFTSQGYAVVGIDMEGHGSRFDPTDHIANMSNRPMFTGVVATPDGFGDTTGPATQLAFFENFLSVSATRDSIRQSALDLSRVVQLLRGQPDLTPLAANAKLDTRHITYTCESFGTVVGTVFAAIEPDIDLYILDVPGGGILDLILPNSPEIATLAVPLIEGIYDPLAPLDRFSPLVGLMQAVIDGADPLTYAPHILRDRFTIAGSQLGPRSVVAIEVVGDQVLSNRGTTALAQELGLDVLSPHLDAPLGLRSGSAPLAANVDQQTAVLVQYEPATHGANWSSEHGQLRFAPGFPVAGDEPFPLLPSPITIPQPIYETLAQVFELLASHQRGESPRVIETMPPVSDFDADGVPDDQDAAPYDPSVH